jgi:hypothetical protein
MSKNQKNALPDNIIEIATTVTYKGETLESAVRLNADDVTNKILNEGPEKANKSIAAVLQSLYTKTNDNFKAVVNK